MTFSPSCRYSDRCRVQGNLRPKGMLDFFSFRVTCQLTIKYKNILCVVKNFDDPLLNSICVPQLMGSFGYQWRRFCSDSEILPLLVVLHYSLEYRTRCFPMKPMSLLMPCKNFDWVDNIKDDLNNCFWFDVGNDNTGLRSGGAALQTIGNLFR